MLCISKKGKNIEGKITIGGSKSETNRHLILQHLVQHFYHIKCGQLLNISTSHDSVNLIKSLNLINAGYKTIDVGDTGTSARFLAAMLSIIPGEWELTGTARMQERPQNELIASLLGLGAAISFIQAQGHLPIKISGKVLELNHISVDCSRSSQFASALMLIAPFMNNGLRIELSGKISSMPYIIATAEILKLYGVDVKLNNCVVDIMPGINEALCLEPKIIESDWSSAGYWLAIAATSQSTGICLEHFYSNSIQPDANGAHIFKAFGVESSFSDGTLMLVKNKKWQQPTNILHFNCTNNPDLAQTLMALCAVMKIKAHFTGLSTLQFKESNRVVAMQGELLKMGVELDILNEDEAKMENFAPANPLSIA